MSSQEKPKVTMKFEVSFPDLEGGPAKKFCVNRTLGVRWVDDPRKVTNDILEEIRNYRGSFVGDLIASLAVLVVNEKSMNLPENKRSLEVDRWAAALVEKLLYSSVNDGLLDDVATSSEIPEWDGLFRSIEEVSPEELESVNMDRLLLLLAPKVKHIVSLAAKSIKMAK